MAFLLSAFSTNMDVVQIVCVAHLCLELIRSREMRKRRWWTHPAISNRLSTGQFHEVAKVGGLFICESVDSRESVCKGMTCLRIPVTSTRAIAVESAIKFWVREPKPYSHFWEFGWQ